MKNIPSIGQNEALIRKRLLRDWIKILIQTTNSQNIASSFVIL
jgi:hypothetical protein